MLLYPQVKLDEGSSAQRPTLHLHQEIMDIQNIQMEISCEQSDVTNQCSEHVENVRDGLDKITFSDSMTNSPWKVTPLRGRLSIEKENLKAALKASEEKLDKATNDFNQNLMQQSEEFEKKLKEADAVFKVKLQQEQANFELIIKQLEDNLSLKSKELEETCQKFQNREYYLNLKLKESEDESEDGFTLKSKELEENCQKFKNVECDLNSKLKQVGNELRAMQKSRDTFKMQLHSLSSQTGELRKKIQLQSKNLEIFTKVSNALKNEKQENFVTEDNIAHYTGLPNIGTFYWLLSMVQQDIHYYFGSAVKCLTNEHQLFITLFKLRRNVSHQLLSDLFEISLFTVSNILITWISVLHIIVVEGIMEKNVPSLHKVRH
ncbi:Laminin subunit beta-4 [Frankliniella fusca]|uniref:Laminin subunit beta-4 n=1 Tax=Frankliniella fusca TaxID=407009 RepID=A0AAE1H7V1_9NEOP|nr:Laminin subunit beta-4 [Frankliniella fusca]